MVYQGVLDVGGVYEVGVVIRVYDIDLNLLPVPLSRTRSALVLAGLLHDNFRDSSGGCQHTGTFYLFQRLLKLGKRVTVGVSYFLHRSEASGERSGSVSPHVIARCCRAIC